MFEYFSSIYDPTVGIQDQWRSQRHLIYFSTRVNVTSEVVKMDNLSLFLKTLSLNEQILKDYIFHTNYKRNKYIFIYKAIYIYVLMYGFIFLLTTFSLF
jgi:hypothetical protein